MSCDLIIVGGGPAGLVLAAEAGEAGLRVVVLAGERSAWTANYGAWVDRFEALGVTGCFSQVWSDVDVHLGDDNPVALGRAYARVDNMALRGSLLSRCAAASVDIHQVDAASVTHGPTGSVVLDKVGGSWSATLCVDASGHGPVLVQRSGRPSLWQAAYGVQGALPGHDLPADRMLFMDLRPAPEADEALPSFLYGMPLSEDRVFLEETSMIRGPAVAFETLRKRLEARLRARGLGFEGVESTELCLIPMDSPLPDLRQRVIGFGGAASMVHPASGYLLPAVFRAAPRVVRSLVDSLGRGADVDAAARAAWRAVWPTSELIRRELFLYGARILADLDTRDTVAFFRAFFSTPPVLWRGYLDDASLELVVRSMGSSFRRCDGATRWKLMRAGAQLPGALWRPVLA
jgi:lycopene cyclase-like protein